MQNKFYIAVAFNGEIINYTTKFEPHIGNKFFHNGKELEVTKISQTLQFVDPLTNAMYYTCIAKEVVSNKPLVGVTQVKFITCPFGGNDAVKSLEDALNEFLWETRHTHTTFLILHIPICILQLNIVCIMIEILTAINQMRNHISIMIFIKNGKQLKNI